MPNLGELEGTIMEALWAHGAATAREVQEVLADRELATTTVLTVLSRLERKDLVERQRDGRAHRYRPTATREDHIAELMRDALDAAPDRQAALARFLGGMPDEEADTLHSLLRRRRR